MSIMSRVAIQPFTAWFDHSDQLRPRLVLGMVHDRHLFPLRPAHQHHSDEYANWYRVWGCLGGQAERWETFSSWLLEAQPERAADWARCWSKWSESLMHKLSPLTRFRPHLHPFAELIFFFDPFLNAIPLRDSPRPTSRTGYRLQFCFSSFCHRCVIFGPEDFKRRAAECDLSWNDTLFPLLCESQDCMMVAPLQSWELLKPIKCIQKASLEKHPRACVCIACVSMCRKTRPNYACGMSSLIYGLYIMHTLFITNIFDYLIYLRVPVWGSGFSFPRPEKCQWQRMCWKSWMCALFKSFKAIKTSRTSTSQNKLAARFSSCQSWYFWSSQVCYA